MATRTSIVKVLVETDASGAASKLGKFGRVAGVAALGVGAVAVGGVLAAKKIYEIGDASDDANGRIENIAKQMKLFGDQTNTVTDRIEKYAEKTARLTGIDANSIKATQAKLLTFKDLGKSADKLGGNFDRATNAAIDMASAGFGTAESNAVMLGKALQDPADQLTSLKRTGALTSEQVKKIGEEFERTGNKAKAQKDILAAVESQVKGTAEATAGGFERMQEVFRQGGDALAKKFLPYIDRFGDFMVDKGLPAIKKFAGELRDRFGPALKRVGEFIQDKVIPAAQDFYRWFVDKIAPGIKRAVTPVIEGARRAFEKIRSKIDDNREPLKKLLDAFKKISEFVAKYILPLFGKQLGKSLEIMGDVIGTAIKVLGTLIDTWDKVGRAIGGAIRKLREWNGMNAGGHVGVWNPGPAPGSAGGNPNPNAVDRVTINVHGFVGNERQLAAEVGRVMRRGRVAGGAAL